MEHQVKTMSNLSFSYLFGMNGFWQVKNGNYVKFWTKEFF
jgi:hypothetical protein